MKVILHYSLFIVRCTKCCVLLLECVRKSVILKKIIIKNKKLWFHSSKKTSYIAEKSADLKYNFHETRWTKGVILDELVNDTTRQITRAANKTFTDLSLTKTDDDEWGK